ncbi:MAG TPA: Spy/CpxP family protein refolding chaperone [Albitalea sp.]|uniref:Spy/CpxP family protein refolding chaperone n=1 Tax=Piscinibacter sp. TaxID=1903157 RepID=UPI002ED5D9EB
MSSSVMVPGQAASHARRSLRWLVAGVVLAIASTIALSAWAQNRPGGHHGGMDGSGMMMFGGHGRGLDRMLDGINATDAQRAQVKQIAQQAAADLKAQHETTRALREKAAQIFTAPTVDAAAAESVRQQLLTQHDAASRRMLQAMLDISRVLTPEQRAQLGEQMKQRHEHMLERMRQHREQQQPKQ